MVREYFFVVHFQIINKNKIVPSRWIYEIDQHIEKFFNYGMNSSQRFRCYYTSNPSAFDEKGCPKIDWEPDFNLAMVQNLDGNELVNGCYVVKLLKCKRKYRFQFHISKKIVRPIPNITGTHESAVSYVNARRNVEPQSYNPNRIRELPIPVLSGAEPNENDIYSESDSSSDASDSIERLLRIDEDENIGETSQVDEVLRTNPNENDTVVSRGLPFICLHRIAVNSGNDDSATSNNKNTENNNNCESDTASETTENTIVNDGNINDNLLAGSQMNASDDGNSNGNLVANSEINATLAASDENANVGLAADSEMNAVCAGFDQNATDPLSQPIKNYEPMHMVNLSNFDQIINYIEEPDEVVVDDELTFYVSSKGYAKPIDTLMDGRCKREKFDKFSGMVKFFNTVR